MVTDITEKIIIPMTLMKIKLINYGAICESNINIVIIE